MIIVEQEQHLAFELRKFMTAAEFNVFGFSSLGAKMFINIVSTGGNCSSIFFCEKVVGWVN